MMSLYKKKTNKYGNKKKIVDGVKYDSKLEYSFKSLLDKFNIHHQFQVPITLQPKFVDSNNKTVRAIKSIVDFIIELDGKTLYIDTKGYATDIAKMKYKMLGYKLKNENVNYEIVFLKTKKEAQSYAIKLYEKFKNKSN